MQLLHCIVQGAPVPGLISSKNKIIIIIIIIIITRQSQTADSVPVVATWEVTLSARKVVPCVRWPATGITAHCL